MKTKTPTEKATKAATPKPSRLAARALPAVVTTDRQVAACKPGRKPFEISVGGARGLLLRVFPNGDRIFEARYVAANGKRRRLAIGPYPAITLVAARDKANKVRAALADGLDPAADRQAARQAARMGETVSELATAYFEAARSGMHGGRRRPKKAATIAHERSLFDHHLESLLGDQRFTEVRRADVRGAMRKIVSAGELAPASIARVGQTLSAIFGFALFEERIESNPCLGLASPLAVTARDRQFDDETLAALWRALVISSTAREGKAHTADPKSRLEPATALALRFAILTLCRRGEIAGARWAEIDRKSKIWLVPADRTKAGRPHVVPLTAPAIEVLDQAAKLSPAVKEFVFPAPDDDRIGLDPRAMTRATSRLLSRLELPAGSVHDFRRTGATVLAAQYGISGFTIGRLLGHQVHEGAAVTAAHYNKYDYQAEMRRALEAWNTHVTLEGAASGNVVKLRPGKGA
jgi:integrase